MKLIKRIKRLFCGAPVKVKVLAVYISGSMIHVKFDDGTVVKLNIPKAAKRKNYKRK